MKTYEVIGTTTVHGAKPGEQFTKDITPEQERALIEGDAIVPVTWTIRQPEGED